MCEIAKVVPNVSIYLHLLLTFTCYTKTSLYMISFSHKGSPKTVRILRLREGRKTRRSEKGSER